MDEAARAYYATGSEAARLGTLARLEHVRTLDVLGRHLPPAPAAVLDVGGGPGGYAVALQRRGYDVRLVDPVALHVEQARAAGIARAAVGDARALEHADGSADAVLLLGPLYHLTAPQDRARALAEAHRVLRADGVLVAAAITRFASLFSGIHAGFLADPRFQAIVERDLTDGQHRNPHDEPRWFTTAFFHHPDELHREVAAAGFGVLALVAVEGPVEHAVQAGGWLEDPARRAVLLRLLRRVEAEPSLLGASPHVLAVGRRGRG